MIITMAIGVGLLTLVLFLIFPVVRGYLYFISMVLMLCSLICIFYLNRFELLVIGIEKDDVHLSFVNNSIFRRKEIKVRKAQVRLKWEGKVLIFLIDGQQQAILRKNAADAADWKNLLNGL
ncbi:hypothetical protein [Chitinophaga ginsengisoli]|nr:hypothetical protein [Chitinophaga ginsengisoli]